MQQIARRLASRVTLFAFALACPSAVVCPSALAQHAGTSRPVGETTTNVEARARALQSEGRVIEARALLADAMVSGVMNGEDAHGKLSGEPGDLLKELDAEIRRMDPVDVAVQRAELALSQGNIRLAERHASVVARNPAASAAQRQRASGVLDGVAAARVAVRESVPGMLDRAAAELAAGNAAGGRELLRAVESTGLEFDAATRERIDGMKLTLLDGGRGAGAVSAGMVQPGVVRRLDETQPPAPSSSPAEPASSGEMTPVESGSGQASPAPAETFDGAAGAAGAGSQPPADDLIGTALRVEGQRLIAEADLARQEGRYNEAIAKYEQVVNSYRTYLSGDEIARAQSGMEDARLRLQTGGTGENLAQDTVERQTLQRQQAEAEFGNLTQQAESALAAGDTVRATDLAARARLTVSRVRGSFSETEYADYTSKVDNLVSRIASASESIRANEASTREKELATKAEQTRKSIADQKQRQIQEAITRVRALQREQKYTEALDVVDSILFLDENNPTGLLLRDVIRDVVLYRRWDEYRRLRRENIAESSLDNEEAAIPPRDLVNYPANWPSKSFKRGDPSAMSMSNGDRRTLAKLDQGFPSAPMRGATLEQFLDYVATITEAPTDVDWRSLEAVGVMRTAPVTVNLSQVPVRKVLDTVLAKVSRDAMVPAGWSVNEGVLHVASEDDLRKTVRPELYNIEDLIFDVPNYNVVPTMDLESVLQRATGDWKTVAIQKRDEERTKRVERRPSREERVTRLIEFIQNTVDYKGWRDSGGDTGSVQEINGNLVITNTPENHREIAGLLAKLRDIRSMQINVETRFLLVNQDFFEQIGFDLDVYFNANNNQVRFARGNDPTVQTSDFFDFSGGGGLKRTITSQGDFAPGQVGRAGFFTQGVVNPRSTSPVGAAQNSLGLGSFLSQDNEFASGLLSQAPALGVAGQFLDDIQVDFMIRATQADRRTVQLTAPRITFTNGQNANVYVATQRAFISDLQPIVGESAAAFDPVPAALTEGVTLNVEGIVSADRRYVTLNVDTSVVRLADIALQPVTAVAGGQLVNSADTQSFIQLPQITITRVQTTATIPDEGTVLLGGQRLTTELEVETGVPVLSKLPIINRFFTNRIESRTEQTLLILAKPTVLIQTEEEEKSFPGLADTLRSGLGG